MTLLSLLTFLPLVGIPLLFMTKDVKTQRWIGLGTAGAAMLVSIWMWLGFDATQTGLAAADGGLNFSHPWISVGESFRINYAMGVDGISMILIVLTGILGFLAALSAFSIEKNVRGFFAMYLLLLTGMFGTFVAMDLFLFYVFWELMLLPMYFLIGIWGGPKREFAAIKFFLYTMVGSVLMLGAFLAIYFQLGTFSIPEILAHHEEIFAGQTTLRIVLFVALFIGFAIKVPLFPFHTWLPLAHVEAPTPISVILAGVLLKMGGYGLIRMAFPWFPDAVVTLWPYLATLAIVSIVYGALVALAQDDWKKLVAYSSVSHMGYVVLGLATLTQAGVNGAVLQMFSHGLLSGMMFLCVGVMYEQAHHRDLNRFGGLLKTLPKYTFVAMIAFFGSLGLPGMSGFVAELMVFFGSFGSKLAHAQMFTIVATLGVVLGAVYILVMIQQVFLGTPKEKPEHAFRDLSLREGITLWPLAVMTLWFGIYPKPAIDLVDPAITEWRGTHFNGFLTADEKKAWDARESGAVPAGREIDTGALPPPSAIDRQWLDGRVRAEER